MISMMPPSWLPLALTFIAVSALAVHSLHLRKVGINPWVLPTGDDAHGFLGRVFYILIALCLIALITWAVWPDWSLRALGGIPTLTSPTIAWIGLAILSTGVVLVIQAQRAMGMQWRVGISEEEKPRLVTTGLFAYSRNPIFVGMLLTALGIAIAIPHALSWMTLAATYISISVQVRLEEAYLDRWLGDAYAQYRKTVRRWI